MRNFNAMCKMFEFCGTTVMNRNGIRSCLAISFKFWLINSYKQRLLEQLTFPPCCKLNYVPSIDIELAQYSINYI
jgi:hypothetical protein